MESYKGEPMCGNTISFDRSFLQAQMPDLENMFHYRNIDISTFNVLFDKLGLETASKGEAHRALADCRSSVTQLKFYMKALGIGEVEDIIGRSGS
jgi:oligoribonuclease